MAIPTSTSCDASRTPQPAASRASLRERRQPTQIPRGRMTAARSTSPLPEAGAMRSGECRPTAVRRRNGSPGMADTWLASRQTESGCITRNFVNPGAFGESRCRRDGPGAAGNSNRAENTVQGRGDLGPGRARAVLLSLRSTIPAVRFPSVRASRYWKPDAPAIFRWEMFALAGGSRSRRTDAGCCARRTTAR